jgi:hypothetical protein
MAGELEEAILANIGIYWSSRPLLAFPRSPNPYEKDGLDESFQLSYSQVRFPMKSVENVV